VAKRRTVAQVIAKVVGDLPVELRRLVRSRVKFVVRKRPTAADIAAGAEPNDRGIFVGFPVLENDGEEDAGADLYAEDEAAAAGVVLAETDSPAVLRADEGDLVAELEPYEPGGTIALFTDNIRPLSEENVVDVLLHEIAHFAGEDEEGAFEVGLAEETEAEGGEAVG